MNLNKICFFLRLAQITISLPPFAAVIIPVAIFYYFMQVKEFPN